MTFKEAFKTDTSVYVLFAISATIAAHKITIDAYVNHTDWFIIYKILDYNRDWFYKTLSLPLWSPFYTAGVTYVSNFPFVLSLGQLLAFLGISATFSIFLLEWVNLLLTGPCMYRLCRGYSINRGPAIAAAVLYQYLTATWLSMEGLPAGFIVASFYLCERYHQSGKARYIFLNFLTVSLYALTAVPHGILIAMTFHWAYALFRLAQGNGKRFATATFVSTLVGLIAGFPSLLLAARDAAVSYRTFYIRDTFNAFDFPFLEALRQIVNVGFQAGNLGPPFFIALALTALFALFYKSAPREQKSIYFVGVLFIAMLACLSNGQGWLQPIPVVGKLLGGFDMQRNFVTPFCTALFSGFFLNALQSRGTILSREEIIRAALILVPLLLVWLVAGNRFREYTLACCIGLVALLWIYTNIDAEWRDRQLVKLLFALSIFCIFVLAQSHVKNVLTVSQKLGLSSIKAIYDDEQLKSRMDYELRESAHNVSSLNALITKEMSTAPYRIIDRDVFTFPQRSYFAMHGFPTFQYFDNTSSARFREFFMWAVDDLRHSDPHKYYQLWHTALFYGRDGSRFNENILSLAGVRLVLMPKASEENRFEKIWEGDRLALYRNQHALPRAFAVFDMKVFANVREVGEHMIQASRADLMNFVPIRHQDAEGFPRDFLSGHGKATVTLTSYEPNDVRLKVQTDANCVVVLTDNHHSTWNAAVDGNPEKIFFAYNTFRMVMVPRGTHEVHFFIRDTLLLTTAKISLGLLLAMAALCLGSEMYRRRLR